MNVTTRNLLISSLGAFLVCLIASTATTTVGVREVLDGTSYHGELSVGETSYVMDPFTLKTDTTTPVIMDSNLTWNTKDGAMHTKAIDSDNSDTLLLSMVGEVAEDYFGNSVSGAGDVNGSVPWVSTFAPLTPLYTVTYQPIGGSEIPWQNWCRIDLVNAAAVPCIVLSFSWLALILKDEKLFFERVKELVGGKMA